MFLEHLEGIQSLVKKQYNGPWLMTLIDFAAGHNLYFYAVSLRNNWKGRNWHDRSYW